MTIKVQDLFNGTPGVDLDARTPDTDVVGGGWTITGANTIELDGLGAAKFSTSDEWAFIDAGTVDQKVVINHTAGGVNRFILLVGRRDATASLNYTGYNILFQPGGPEISINKVVAGVWTELAADRTTTWSTSVTYKVEFLLETGGTNELELKIDNTSYLTSGDTALTSGNNSSFYNAGLTGVTGQRVYDFQVDDYAAASSSIAPLRRRIEMRRSA